MILGVDFEVLCEVVDALAEESDLNFRRSRVAVMRFVAADDPGLAILVSATCWLLHEWPRNTEVLSSHRSL